MDYQVVYDFAKNGYQQWWLIVVSIVLSSVLVLCIVFREPLQRISGRAFIPVILWGAVIIILVSAGVGFIRSYGAYRTILNAVQAGHSRVVEGRVTQFQPAVLGRGAATEESFVVGGKRFIYSDSPALGFHETHVYGGPIKEGLNIRIVYVPFDGRDVITRLEIAKQ